MRLSIQLAEISFVGAPLEYDPAIWVEGTWEGARHGRLTPVFQGPGATHEIDFPLPPGGQVRAGDMIWLSLVAHTKQSGIKDIDEKEAAYRETRQESGELCVSPEQLLAAAARKDSASAATAVPFSDHMLHRVLTRKILLADVASLPEAEQYQVLVNPAGVLGKERANVLAERIFMLSCKGSVKLSARRIDDVPHWAGQPKTKLPARPLVFGSKEYAAAAERVNTRLEEQYVLHATAMSLPSETPGGSARVGLFPHAPDDPLMEFLHLARFETRAGPLPIAAYMLQDLRARSPTMAAAELDESGAAAHGRYMDVLQRRLLSSLLAHGMSAGEFVRVVTGQHARKDDQVDPRYVVAVTSVLHVATLAANRIKYKADARVPNLPYMRANLTEAEQRVFMPPEYFGDVAKKVDAMMVGRRGIAQATTSYAIPPLPCMSPLTARLAVHAMMGRAAMDERRRRRPRGSLQGATEQGPARVLSAAYVADDDWDFGGLSGKMDADDCEGVAATAVAIQERNRDALNRVAALPGAPGMTKELRALQTILNTFEPLFVGGTVSEPYVKDEGKAGATTASSSSHPIMPIKGSPEAAEWPAGGHGLGLLIAQALRAKLQLNSLEHFPQTSLAKEDRKRLEALLKRQVEAAPPWLLNNPSLRFVIEGTGPVNPSILPAAETFPRAPVFAAKVGARMDFVRALKNKGFAAAAAASKTGAPPLTHVEELTLIADCLRAESQPYEKEARTNPLQWVSPFYRGVAGIVSLRAYVEESPVLAACSAIDLRGKVRGVDMATMLTSCVRDVAFHPQYGAGVSDAEWKRDVAPYVEATLEHCSLSNYLRDLDHVPTAAQVAVPLSSKSLCHLAAASPTYIQAALDGAVEHDDLSALAAIEAASRNDKQEVLALTLDAQFIPVMGEAKAASLVRALDRLQTDGKILRYALVRDQPLLQCASCLQVLLLLPVL